MHVFAVALFLKSARKKSVSEFPNFFHEAETKCFHEAKNFIRGKFEDPRLELFP